MSMNFKKLFSAISVFLLVVCMLPAFSMEVEIDGIRDPDTRKRRDDDYIGVIIKTNVEGAEVYINGKEFGTTPLATVELSDTTYRVEIRKDGYDTIKCRIRPRRYYTSTYIFVMEKTCGFISVKNVPSGASVYIDGVKESSFPMEVYPGSHTIKVRKFGYEDFSEQVYVENHRTVQRSISLKTAPFTISRFKVSKNSINPDYSSSLGKATVSFYVTNDGSALLMINDRYGNTVWSYQFSSFSTWEQSITWNGRGSDGEILPDGQYTVKLINYDYEFSDRIKIDRSMVYPLVSVTPNGSGLGTMPCAFANGINYVRLFSVFGANFNTDTQGNPLSSIPISAGFVVDFAKYFELAGSIGADISTDGSGTAIKGGGSFKGGAGIKLSNDVSLNFAGFAGYNVERGLALGASASVDTGDGLVGITGEYYLGATMKRIDGNKQSDIIKYGVIISFLPVQSLRTSVWGAMHNDKYIEAGAELITMPGSGAFSFDAKAYLVKDIKDTGNKNMSINAQIGLSYLF